MYSTSEASVSYANNCKDVRGDVGPMLYQRHHTLFPHGPKEE
jgi:hypothetical protein